MTLLWKVRQHCIHLYIQMYHEINQVYSISVIWYIRMHRVAFHLNQTRRTLQFEQKKRKEKRNRTFQSKTKPRLECMIYIWCCVLLRFAYVSRNVRFEFSVLNFMGRRKKWIQDDVNYIRHSLNVSYHLGHVGKVCAHTHQMMVIDSISLNHVNLYCFFRPKSSLADWLHNSILVQFRMAFGELFGNIFFVQNEKREREKNYVRSDSLVSSLERILELNSKIKPIYWIKCEMLGDLIHFATQHVATAPVWNFNLSTRNEPQSMGSSYDDLHLRFENRRRWCQKQNDRLITYNQFVCDGN